MKFYLKNIDEVYQKLETQKEGLSSEEAKIRLERDGKNKLDEGKKTPLWKKFLSSISDPMIIMLIAAAVIQAVVTTIESISAGSASFLDFADVVVILAVVIINTIMSLIQESKAEAAMDALMEMTASTAKVYRDGKIVVIKSEELVKGDIIYIEAGDAITADCRIIESHSLKVEEAALTGESVPVNKMIDALMLQNNVIDVPLGDRTNMLYSGSTIVYGRGLAVVCATAMDTEMGKIASALATVEKEQTPLQKKMAQLSGFLTKLVIIICAVVLLVGIIENIAINGFTWASFGKTSLNTFIAAIALAVAAIPEGLPAVVTIILSIGVTQMSKRQALIRKLTAVETLGCTQIICSDKTGTLTQNKMTVVKEFTKDKLLLAKAMALCSDATINEGETEATGEPTEVALVNYAFKNELPRYLLEQQEPRVGEAPFDSMRKMMSTIHQIDGKYIQYTKGALDVLLERCNKYFDGKDVLPLDDKIKEEIKIKNKEFADGALRVLAASYREYDMMPKSMEAADLEQDLIFIGIVGMIDPCRPEVYAAIKECKEAGIRPIMITGDHKDTAVAIGKDLGIIESEEQAIVGAELDKYSDEEMLEIVPKYSVYARVQPEHKTRIVQAWKALGMVTAMTGDGVNDAPSIKASDIGIGMGITGTDVTKGAADMVLADDNFATIVNAVEEGRKIYDNVCKVLQFQLSTNMSEVIIMFIASILNFTILTPVHLLWINMVTDSLPGLALGMEKAEANIMKRKPRPSTEGIFSNGAGIDMVWQGVAIAILEILAYVIGYALENKTLAGLAFSGGTICVNAMAMAFLTVNFAEMFTAVCMRSRNGSILSKSMFKNMNWWLVGAFGVTTLLTLAAIYIPGLNSVFGIENGTFEFSELLISFGLALLVVPIFEVGKLIRRRINNK